MEGFVCEEEEIFYVDVGDVGLHGEPVKVNEDGGDVLLVSVWKRTQQLSSTCVAKSNRMPLQ